MKSIGLFSSEVAVIAFAFLIIALNTISSQIPADADLNVYFTAGNDWAFIRSILVAPLVLFATNPFMRTKLLRILLAVLGIVLIGLCFIGPFMWDRLYLAPIDFFLIIEGAILAFICSSELPYVRKEVSYRLSYQKNYNTKLKTQRLVVQ